jgi:hypothetical protein
MTKRKMKIMSSKATRIIPTSVMPSKVSELERTLVDDIDVLGQYHDANLRAADLTRAYLSGANLREANLAGANLREANFSVSFSNCKNEVS